MEKIPKFVSCHLDLKGDLESTTLSGVSLSCSSPKAAAPSQALARGCPAGTRWRAHLGRAADSSPPATDRKLLFTSKHLAPVVPPFCSLLSFISHYFSDFGFHPKNPSVSSPAAPLLINIRVSVIPYERMQRYLLSRALPEPSLGLRSPAHVSWDSATSFGGRHRPGHAFFPNPRYPLPRGFPTSIYIIALKPGYPQRG